jgi:phasin family protein
MAVEKFPFAFDAEKVKEMFAAVKMPVVDVDAVIAAQQKNVDAVIEANKVALAGYQDVFKRQVALFEAAVAQAKEKFSAPQTQPMSIDQAEQNVEAMKAAFEKAAADVRELTEMVQKANTGAFEIVKARVEEAVAELKAAAEKIAA